jgi:hypothetical protein
METASADTKKRAAGAQAVRSMIAEAQEVPAVGKKGALANGKAAKGGAAGKWRTNGLGLPEDCPVIPLGMSGNRCWFIDRIGQLQYLDPPYGKGHILGLFCGHSEYLSWAWPRWGKDGSIDGYAAEQVANALIEACAAKEPWDAADHVRGRGMWRDAGGGLLYHAGTKMLRDGATLRPCEIEGHVYPTRPAIAAPWPSLVTDKENPAGWLLELFSSWQWARPDVDPVLLLGWIGAAHMGAALPWRPAAFITGDKATGKSTLQHVVKCIFGDALIQSADTSAAGIYQHVGQDCLPVAVDELESESDVRKQKAVLKLARLAASGALMLRGGDRHSGVEFQARSAFLFSSINTPPLEPQNLSRMAILRLARFPAGQAAPVLDEQAIANAGRMILRRLIDQWDRFSQTYEAFRGELAAGGMDGRGQDTFCTLLTCADMIAHDGWDEERLRAPADGDLKPWRELMASATMAEFEDAEENWRLCLNHMLSVQVEAWRNGVRRTVGQVLTDFYCGTGDSDIDLTEARRLLAQAGLGIVQRMHDRRQFWLAVPNQNALTRTLFAESKWAGETGASVWAGALRQSPADDIHEVGRAKINGVMQRVTLISLEGLYGDGRIMSEEG